MASSPVSALDAVAREITALPDGAAWIRGALLKRLVAAVIRDRARAGTNVDEIPTDRGRFFNAQAGTASIAAVTPWQASLSPWTGQGSDPYAGSRDSRFRLNDGNVNGQTPSNMNQEFVAFGDITDTGIEEQDAVITFAYWQASVHETQTGQGDFGMDRPEIKTIEGQVGDSLVNLISPPDIGADGSFPPYIVGQICIVQNYGGALHFPPGLNAYLGVVPVVTGALDGIVTRQFQYTT